MHLFTNTFALWHGNEAQNRNKSTKLFLNKYYVAEEPVDGIITRYILPAVR